MPDWFALASSEIGTYIARRDRPVQSAPVSYMHHVRRRAHRVARTPRRVWRRVYQYRDERLSSVYPVRVITPMSRDAPMEEEDARFWDWTFFVILAAAVVGLIIWGVSSWA